MSAMRMLRSRKEWTTSVRPLIAWSLICLQASHYHNSNNSNLLQWAPGQTVLRRLSAILMMMSLISPNTVSLPPYCDQGMTILISLLTRYTVNPSSVDLDSEELSGTSQPPFGSAQDPLAQYLDPSLAGFGGSSRDTSLGASGIPLSSTNPLASIPQNHQYASSAPQAVPASSLDVERGVKAEPSPTPSPAPSIAGDAGVTSTTSSGRKASKMPAKMPARSSKRRLSTSVSKPAEQASDSQRRSTRQKTGKT